MTQAKITVQKGIPLPARGANAKPGSGRPMKYPFRTMQVGDSFEVTADKLDLMSSRMHRLGKNAAPDRKFATRKTGDNTMRVWRIV